MKIKSLLSLVVCGMASQLLVSCSSSSQYFDFSAPTATYYKKAPKAQVAPAEDTQNQVEAVGEPAANETVTLAAAPVVATTATSAKPSQDLQAKAGKATASASVARTAPLTTAAVAEALAANPKANDAANELANAKSKKEMKAVVKKLKREAKGTQARLNYYIKVGIVLLLAGALLALIPGLGTVGGIVAVIGIVFIVLGLLEIL